MVDILEADLGDECRASSGVTTVNLLDRCPAALPDGIPRRCGRGWSLASIAARCTIGGPQQDAGAA